MKRQSVNKAQLSKNSNFLSSADIFQRKTIKRTDFGASTVDTWGPSDQQIDNPGPHGAETHFRYDFSKVPVTLNSPCLVQARLKIGQRDDKYEQEADRIADQVMRMPDPVVQRKPG
jgi:hypothetical protein